MANPDFTASDKFKAENNFNQVVFGDNAFVLEVELNELQKIQNYQRRLMAQVLAKDGFVQRGTMTLSNGILTIPADTILINGYLIELSEPMSITVSPGDTVYIAASEVVVTSVTALMRDGNQDGGSPIANEMIDVRIGSETSRRVQIQLELLTYNTDGSKSYLSVANIVDSTTFVDQRTQLSTNVYSTNLVGTPTAPTAPVDTDTDQIATTAFVTNQLKPKMDTARFNTMYNEWDAEDITLNKGELIADVLCWKGQSVQYAQPSTGAIASILGVVTCNTLRYGSFSVSFRIKSSDASSSSAIMTLKVASADGTTVASLALKGTDFTDVGANTYKTVQVPFINKGQSAGNAFTFSVTSEAIASTIIGVDSILVQPVNAAGYGGVTA